MEVLHNRLGIVAAVSAMAFLCLKDLVSSPLIPGLSIKMDGVCILRYSRCNFFLNVITVTQCLIVILSPHF